MNPFGNDPFDDMIRRFFGSDMNESYESDVIEGEEEDRTIDFIETSDKVYLVFELPGYEKDDVSVSVEKSELSVSAKRSPRESDDPYMAEKLRMPTTFKKSLPKFVKPKPAHSTFRNGVLEVSFNKK